MSSAYYSVFQVDKPNVPEEEIASALQFNMKDLVTFPVEDQVIDYFDLPVQAGGANKINATVCNKKDIELIIDSLLKAKIDLQGISIEELVFIHLENEDERPYLLLHHYPKGELLLSIIKQGALYFTRHYWGI